MTLHPDQLPRVVQEHRGFLTREEMGFYLRVGKNEVAGIAKRFGLRPLEGLFPERALWRQILGLEPVTAQGEDLLRLQLQDIHWVAGRTGRAVSTLRNRIRSGSFNYPPGVQLGAISPGRTPRLRRWLPEVIEAAREGRALAGIRPVPRQAPLAQARDKAPLAACDGTAQDRACTVAPEPGAVLAAIAGGAMPPAVKPPL